MPVADSFARAFHVTIGEEGGFSADPADPGNWTGGAVGEGLCQGTKFGISARAYPTLDIAALTLAEAQAIYRRDYWAPVGGDAWPLALGILLFDAAVNAGVGAAIRWLQEVVGVAGDGVIGPATRAAVARAALSDLCARFQRARLIALPDARAFRAGWEIRLFRVTLAAGAVLDVE